MKKGVTRNKGIGSIGFQPTLEVASELAVDSSIPENIVLVYVSDPTAVVTEFDMFRFVVETLRMRFNPSL